MGKQDLVSLDNGRHMDIFSLQNADDNLFGNYQRYNFYQILWLTKVDGDNSYFLDFDEYTLKDNQIIVIFPGQIDRMDISHKRGFLFAIEEHVYFEINERLQSAFLNGYFGNMFLSVDSETDKKLLILTQLMQEELKEEARLPLLRSYLEAFLFHIISLFEQTDEYRIRKDTQIGELMRLVDIHFIEQRDTNFYADKLKMTNKKLNIVCTQRTGKTVKQHLQDRLLLEAKREIRLGSKSLKEIAYDLGFSEAAYFTRFFKKHTSLTPSEFRDIG